MKPTELSQEHKKQLRKIKAGPLYDTARNLLNCGIVSGPGLSEAYIQFDKDVKLYGLYEALLYAEGYEQQGHFVEGTVSKICEALTKKM